MSEQISDEMLQEQRIRLTLQVWANFPDGYENVKRSVARELLSLRAELAAIRAQVPADGFVLVPRTFLKGIHQAHYECEDPWYSCPKSQDGCANDRAGADCNCGADAFNAELDEVLSAAPGPKP